MKVVNPEVELLKHGDDEYAFIERVGRVCYKSEDKITAGSKYDFIKMLMDRKHFAMFEHEHVYFVLEHVMFNIFEGELNKINYVLNQDGRCKVIRVEQYLNIGRYKEAVVVSGSFRAFYEFLEHAIKSGVEDIRIVQTIGCKLRSKYELIFDKFTFDAAVDGVKLLTRKEFIAYCDKHSSIARSNHLVHTARFVCDRGVSHEIVRQRPCSFGQESTRYCNYSKGKYGSEITVIKPLFYGENSESYSIWEDAMRYAEKAYMKLMDLNPVAQEARSVLPNSLKTEIIVTAVETEWQVIVDLRYHGTTGAPHPQMKEVMAMAYRQLVADDEVTIIH